MLEYQRQDEYFLYPYPTKKFWISNLWSGIAAKVGIQAAEVVYDQFIDESYWQYQNGKQIDHAAAVAGGFKGTIIRATIGLNTDTAFKAGNWKRALDAGEMVQVYAFFLGGLSGINQADAHLNATKELADEISKDGGILVSYGDYEADGYTVSVPTRQTRMLEFQNYLRTNARDNGIYSSVKYWQELYGNIKPPDWCWLWGAHWTPAVMGTFPSSWDPDKIVAWQYAVWDKYAWGRAVPGNTPSIDVNKWIWKYGDMKSFLKWGSVPVHPPTDCCAELDSKISDLSSSVGSQIAALSSTVAGKVDQATFNTLANEVYKLKTQLGYHVPVTVVNVPQDSVLRWDRSYNGAKKPKYDFYPTGSTDNVPNRIHVSGGLLIFPIPLTGDGGMVCYPVVDSTLYTRNNIPAGITLFIRKDDIVFPT